MLREKLSPFKKKPSEKKFNNVLLLYILTMKKQEQLEIKLVETKDEMDQFLRIFNYWHKKGLIGFVPIFILYKSKDKGELSILKLNDTIVGIAWLIQRKRPYEFVQMKTLAIEPSYIEQGLGKQFLTDLITPPHLQGLDIHTSVVTTNERALNLYLDLGFVVCGKKELKNGLETYELILPA